MFEFRGLVSCRNRSGSFLLQRFPLAEIAHPFRGHGLPCSYPSHFPEEATQAVRRPFRCTRTEARHASSPADYGFPFPVPKHASRSSWAQAARTLGSLRLHLLRSVVPPASPCAPTRVAPRQRSILSWGFRPSEAFAAHTLNPRTLRSPKRTIHSQPEGREQDIPNLAVHDVRCNLHNRIEMQIASAESNPRRDWPESSRDDCSSPLTLPHRAHSGSWPSEP
jgi:hypothetical protein